MCISTRTAPGRAIAAAAVLLPLALAGRAPAAVTGGSFVDTGDDTTERFFHAASKLADGSVMVTGGLRVQLVPPALVSQGEISIFDPKTRQLSTSFEPTGGGDRVVPVLAVARSSHTQTTLADGRVLVTGGNVGAAGTSPGTPTDSVELFDPATGAVTPGPAMSEARAAHTATRLADGRVLVAGGSSWQLFDPAGGWSTPQALQHARTSHAAVLVETGDGPRVLLVGGAGTGGATLELVDPDGGSALSTGTLAVAVDDLGAAPLADGTVLVVGGQDLATGDTVDDAYVYDPFTDELVPVDPPPNRADGIADHETVALGSAVAVFGGEEQISGFDIELDYAALFDTASRQWVFSGAMSDVRDDFAAVVLDDGSVLLVDGAIPFLSQVLSTNAVERFVPEAGATPDVNCDGGVDVLDLLAVLAAWGPCPEPCPPTCAADVDANCAVNVLDLLDVLAAWN